MSEKKTLGKFKYQITGNAVYMWLDSASEDAPPFMYQPYHPHTSIPFSSDEEAEQWAIEYINKY